MPTPLTKWSDSSILCKPRAVWPPIPPPRRSMADNLNDVKLLHADPRTLILNYQPLIRWAARNAVSANMIPEDEFDDAVQSVNIQLLVKVPAMQDNYNNTTYFITYLTTIIRNILKKLYHDARPLLQGDIVGPGEAEAGSDGDLERDIAIWEARKGFTQALALFHLKRERILLFLKLLYGIPLEEDDLLRTYPHASPETLRCALLELEEDLLLGTSQEIFARATPWLNRLEEKVRTPGAYYRWARTKANAVAQIMNKRLPGARFDAESLGAVVELMIDRPEEVKKIFAAQG